MTRLQARSTCLVFLFCWFCSKKFVFFSPKNFLDFLCGYPCRSLARELSISPRLSQLLSLFFFIFSFLFSLFFLECFYSFLQSSVGKSFGFFLEKSLKETVHKSITLCFICFPPNITVSMFIADCRNFVFFFLSTLQKYSF